MQNKNIAMMLMGIAVISSVGGFALSNNVDATVSTTSDTGGITGHVEVSVVNQDGTITAYRQSDNAVLNVGKNFLVDDLFLPSPRLNSTGTLTNNFNYIEVDTVNTAPAETQTGLLGTNACSRVQDGTVAAVSNAGNSVVTIDATIDGAAANCAATFAEAGLFNASTGGEIFARNTFTSVALTSADDLVVTWNITFD